MWHTSIHSFLTDCLLFADFLENESKHLFRWQLRLSNHAASRNFCIFFPPSHKWHVHTCITNLSSPHPPPSYLYHCYCCPKLHKCMYASLSLPLNSIKYPSPFPSCPQPLLTELNAHLPCTAFLLPFFLRFLYPLNHQRRCLIIPLLASLPIVQPTNK